MDYYEREAYSELALEFYVEFRRCADEIGRRARSYPITSDGLRRMNLNRFPFHLLFEILNENEVEIFVVKHDSRDPAFGSTAVRTLFMTYVRSTFRHPALPKDDQSIADCGF